MGLSYFEFVKTENLRFKWYIRIARGAGYCLNLNAAFITLLASPMFRSALHDTALCDVLPLDSAFPTLHIVVACIIVLSVLIHAPFHMVKMVGWKKWKWGFLQTNLTVITGATLILIFVVIVQSEMPSLLNNHFHISHKV